MLHLSSKTVHKVLRITFHALCQWAASTVGAKQGIWCILHILPYNEILLCLLPQDMKFGKSEKLHAFEFHKTSKMFPITIFTSNCLFPFSKNHSNRSHYLFVFSCLWMQPTAWNAGKAYQIFKISFFSFLSFVILYLLLTFNYTEVDNLPSAYSAAWKMPMPETLNVTLWIHQILNFGKQTLTYICLTGRSKNTAKIQLKENGWSSYLANKIYGWVMKNFYHQLKILSEKIIGIS